MFPHYPARDPEFRLVRRGDGVDSGDEIVPRFPVHAILTGDAFPMKSPPTMLTGPLGSTVHVLRADAGTIAELAAIDWNRYFPRVCLDPVRGLITLMSPSHLHEDLSEIFGHIVDVAGSELAGAAKGIRCTRLRGRGEPPGTGMEPDCAFYVGERAREFRDVLVTSRNGGGRLHRADRPRPGGGGRDHQCRRGQGGAVRGDGGAGAVAAARAQGVG